LDDDNGTVTKVENYISQALRISDHLIDLSLERVIFIATDKEIPAMRQITLNTWCLTKALIWR
jgi:hypothetical protein